MIKRLRYFLLVGAIALPFLTAITSRTTYAHFLLQDTSTGISASFHCAPDDDPIAGQQSILSFDFSKSEKGIQADVYDFALTVKGETGKAEQIPFEINSNVIITKYTFPQQGLYKITLEVKPKLGSGKVSRLEYNQRVSRGVVKSQSIQGPSASNKVILALICLVLISAIVLIVREFRRQSKSN